MFKPRQLLFTLALALQTTAYADTSPSLTRQTALSPPVLTLEREANTVALRWDAIPDTQGYRLYYAPYPSATPIQIIDLSTRTDLNTVLPDDAAYYVAITTYRGQTESAPSNIEYVIIDKPLSATQQTVFNSILEKVSQTYPTLPAISAKITFPNGQTWQGARGKADIKTGRNIRNQDTFEIGSITKAFTATIILQLVEEGKLKLNDPVIKYLPDLKQLIVINGKDYTDQVTIQHLLQHESGIPDYANDKQIVTTAEQLFGREAFLQGKITITTAMILEIVKRFNQNGFIPAQKIEYSNTNYILLGMLMEKILNQTSTEIFRERIYKPLNLHFTHLKSADSAWGYTMRNYDDTNQDTTAINGSVYGTAGAIISNHDELHRFFIATLNGKFFKKPETTTQARQPNNEGYNLNGYITFQLDGKDQAYTTAGTTVGQITQMIYMADKNILFSITINQSSQTAEQAMENIIIQLIQNITTLCTAGTLGCT